MSLALTSKRDVLFERAAMFAQVRAFFSSRDVLEVDVPLLYRGAPIDTHIDLIEANCGGERAFLHSSPEFGMKRLLSEGVGDCFQLSHVFRNHESGSRHNPEFTMIEWYRLGFSLEELMQETAALVRTFLPEITQDIEILSYQGAFERHLGYFPQTIEERDYHFAFSIEPHLGQKCLTFLTDYPPEQAALARTRVKEGGVVAERFELFYQGVELANGYHELCDPVEQRRRFEEENNARVAHGKESYPIDEEFLEALERGLPDCSGVALGFDRLMMLRCKTEQIEDVLPFIWQKNEQGVC